MSLTDGYQVKEETLKAFEIIFPDDGERDDKVYQNVISNMHKVQSNNPLYM